MQVNNQWNQVAALVAAAVLLTAGGVSPGASQPSASALKGIGPSPNLPRPQPSESATRFAEVVGWPENLTPKAPDGFQVEAFARDLESPRWLYVLPNGDVLVSQARSHPRSRASADKRKGMAGAGSIGVSPNRITLLRDSDRDGRAETQEMFLTNLNQPLGVALIDDTLYVANTDGLMRFSLQGGTDEDRGCRHAGAGASSRRLQQPLDEEHCGQCRQIETLHIGWIGQRSWRVRDGYGGSPREHSRDQPRRVG